MTMISYAQNFEDVMLNRVFCDIKEGFYIDVGANDPVEDSVTKHFYDNGWTGINIEPLQIHHQELQKQRPKDINLKVAISNEEGELDFWESETRGWSTASKESIELHQEENNKGKIVKVPCTTLQKICDKYVKGEIHFLKIDVEGLEKLVLESNNWLKYRPWIVVVEATLPNSQIENYDSWECILQEKDYTFVYADGLNRFYLSKEHLELSDRLKYPPNVFDQFTLFKTHSRNIKIQELTHKNNELIIDNKQKVAIIDRQDGLLKMIDGQHKQDLEFLEKQSKSSFEQNQKALEQQLFLQELVKNNEVRIENLLLEHKEEIISLDQKYNNIIDELNEKLTEQKETIGRLQNNLVVTSLLKRDVVSLKCEIMQNVSLHEKVEKELDYTKAELARIHRTNHLAHLRVQCLENSRSWRITKPLRMIGSLFRTS